MTRAGARHLGVLAAFAVTALVVLAGAAWLLGGDERDAGETSTSSRILRPTAAPPPATGATHATDRAVEPLASPEIAPAALAPPRDVTALDEHDLVVEVRDANGRGLRDAEVHLETMRGRRIASLDDVIRNGVSLATTEVDGVFVVRRLRAGVMLEASADGYATVTRRLEPADVTASPVVVTLRRAARVEGRVSCADGVSGAGVAVTLRRTDDAQVSRMTMTDPDGRYAFAGLEPAEYAVHARRDGYAVAPRTFSVAPGGTAVVDILLAPALSLAGVVVGADGTLQAGARVSVRNEASSLSLVSGGTTRTDDAGRFAFAGLAPGPHRIDVDTGLASERHEVELVEGEDAWIELRLRGYPWVEGRVTSARAPVADVAVATEDAWPLRSVITDADGAFRFSLGGPGVYRLVYRAPGGFLHRGPTVEVDWGDVAVWDLELGRAAVELSMRDTEGRAVADVDVRLAGAAGSQWARSDADGRVRFESVPPGRYAFEFLATLGDDLGAPLALDPIVVTGADFVRRDAVFGR